MQFNKKLSKAGSLTIPAALRRAAGIEAGEKFSVNLQEDGSVLLKRTQGNCIFCQAEHDIISYKGRLVCKPCIKSMEGEGA